MGDIIAPLLAAWVLVSLFWVVNIYIKRDQPQPQSKRKSKWAFMEKFEIPHLDLIDINYLTRWRIIQTPWFALYLHRMDTPDSRPTLHDHPWNFRSLVLRGGYVERRLDPKTREVYERTVRRFNHMRTHDAHSIKSLLRVPTWTLVFIGARRRVWGYWEKDIFHAYDCWLWTAYDQHFHHFEFEDALARHMEGDQ